MRWVLVFSFEVRLSDASHDNEIKVLKARIAALEAELQDRERDLSTYRDELQKANRKLESLIENMASQLQLASQIQKRLVPTEFPNIPGLEFSTKFEASAITGGDYFDIFEHEDRFRFGIVVASSSGYSMSSLFLSVLLRMSGRSEGRRATSPFRFVEGMIKEIVPHIQAQDPASIFYALVDRRTFQMTYCSLGNTVCLHSVAATNKVHRLAANGPAVSADFQWSSVHEDSPPVQLNAKDRLVIGSEGAVRVQNPSGEAFGEERLYKAVFAAPRQGVHEARNEIMYQLERFANGKEIPQDVTVLVAEVKDKIIKLA